MDRAAARLPGSAGVAVHVPRPEHQEVCGVRGEAGEVLGFQRSKQQLGRVAPEGREDDNPGQGAYHPCDQNGNKYQDDYKYQ